VRPDDARDPQGPPAGRAHRHFGFGHPGQVGTRVSSIDSRLRRLEERGDSCPECGLSAAARRPIAVVYPEDSDKGFEGDPYEACGACGEPLYTVIRVVYDADGGEGRS
jgi:hypothetical protein